MQRLAVLPFRLLKPDPAYDYLGPSLAEALVGALSGSRVAGGPVEPEVREVCDGRARSERARRRSWRWTWC